jgi:uncharacterized protein YcbK (DUF882 family)
MKIKEYFKDHELECSCGCGLMPNYEAVEMLYILRMLWNRKLKINSAARCWNNHVRIYKELGSPVAKRSKHLDGIAFDVAMPKANQAGFKKLAQEVGFNGIGTYSWGVHIDLRDSKKMWYR